MDKPLIAVLNEHVRLTGESISDFAKQIRSLTLVDRDWFKRQFSAEFGYTIVEKPAA